MVLCKHLRIDEAAYGPLFFAAILSVFGVVLGQTPAGIFQSLHGIRLVKDASRCLPLPLRAIDDAALS